MWVLQIVPIHVWALDLPRQVEVVGRCVPGSRGQSRWQFRFLFQLWPKDFSLSLYIYILYIDTLWVSPQPTFETE